MRLAADAKVDLREKKKLRQGSSFLLLFKLSPNSSNYDVFPQDRTKVSTFPGLCKIRAENMHAVTKSQ